jgi:hypothetical protein
MTICTGDRRRNPIRGRGIRGRRGRRRRNLGGNFPPHLPAAARNGVPLRQTTHETIRTIMPYSLKQAAEATAKSKPTILRAIQSGKVSAIKDPHGEWQIEPAELHRVYEAVPERIVSKEDERNDTHQSESSFETGMLSGEVEQLRERLTLVHLDRERERKDASDQIADLRRRLDQSEQERRDAHRQITALLTDQRDKAEEPPPEQAAEPAEKPGFWSRLLFGSGGRS